MTPAHALTPQCMLRAGRLADVAGCTTALSSYRCLQYRIGKNLYIYMYLRLLFSSHTPRRKGAALVHHRPCANNNLRTATSRCFHEHLGRYARVLEGSAVVAAQEEGLHSASDMCIYSRTSKAHRTHLHPNSQYRLTFAFCYHGPFRRLGAEQQPRRPAGLCMSWILPLP